MEIRFGEFVFEADVGGVGKDVVLEGVVFEEGDVGGLVFGGDFLEGDGGELGRVLCEVVESG